MEASRLHPACLVIGYGSIGARHARLLTSIGCRTGVVSRRVVDFPELYADLAGGLSALRPDYVVIANATGDHYRTFSQLAQLGYVGRVLVEKPVFGSRVTVPPNAFRQIFVGYNLRFHPIIERLRMLLLGQQVISAEAYVGQHLPDWRPSTDYRTSYSASTERGGGALRDLSHELDYLTWMFGGWERVSALGGHFSSLEIDSDDVFAVMLVTPRCPVVALQLNYLDRLRRRFVIINTSDHTIEADLVRSTITVDRNCESFTIGPDYTYGAMHAAVLSGTGPAPCPLGDGLEIVRLTEAIETAASRREWVFRDA